jgi:hypothetical protein
MICRKALDARQQPLVGKGRGHGDADRDSPAPCFQALEGHGQVIKASLKFTVRGDGGG